VNRGSRFKQNAFYYREYFVFCGATEYFGISQILGKAKGYKNIENPPVKAVFLFLWKSFI